MALTLAAHAKINIGLRIVGRRQDGYHLLHTLFQEIDFGDEVTLTERPSGETSLEVNGPAVTDVPMDEQNLCLRAAQLFREHTGHGEGVHIRLEKHIPPGTGLGGGSSDAAAVLRGLNQLWRTDLPPEELQRLAAQLGADVPFFIRGGLQLGEGIGERPTPLKWQLPYTVVLVIPPFSVDTAWAYRQFASRELFSTPPGFDRLIMQDPIPWGALTNDFEEVVFPAFPELAEIKAGLLEAGAVHAGLSGSGSGVYGLFEDLPPSDELEEGLPNCRVVHVKLISAARSE